MLVGVIVGVILGVTLIVGVIVGVMLIVGVIDGVILGVGVGVVVDVGVAAIYPRLLEVGVTVGVGAGVLVGVGLAGICVGSILHAVSVQVKVYECELDTSEDINTTTLFALTGLHKVTVSLPDLIPVSNMILSV